MSGPLLRALLGVGCVVLAASAVVLALVAGHEQRLQAVAGRRMTDLDAVMSVLWQKSSGARARLYGQERPVQGMIAPAGLVIAGMALGLAFGGSASGVWGAGCGLLAAVVTRRASDRRHLEQTDEGFRSFLRDVQLNSAGGELAGRAIAQAALRTRGELRASLDQVVAGWQSGTPLEEALSRLPVLRSCQGYWSFLQSVSLHSQTGASLAELVGAVVDQGEESRLRQGELRAKAADARWTARVLAVVPPALGLYLFASDRTLWNTMFYDRAGRTGALVGGALWLLGAIVVGRMQLTPPEFRG